MQSLSRYYLYISTNCTFVTNLWSSVTEKCYDYDVVALLPTPIHSIVYNRNIHKVTALLLCIMNFLICRWWSYSAIKTTNVFCMFALCYTNPINFANDNILHSGYTSQELSEAEDLSTIPKDPISSCIWSATCLKYKPEFNNFLTRKVGDLGIFYGYFNLIVR